MRHSLQVLALAAAALTVTQTAPALAESGVYEVYGVKGEDMLKMRAGPGTGYRVVVGLPNGTLVRVQSCEQTGSTRWCKVSLQEARSLRGYVSRAYLMEE